MQTRNFLSLLLLLAATWGCKKDADILPSPSSVTSSTATETSSLVSNPKFPSPDIGLNLIPNGVYYIMPMAHPELYLTLDVPWTESREGSPIRQNKQVYKCYSTNQMWSVTYLGNGYYSIINYSSGKSLDAPGGVYAPGTNIQQYTYNGGPNQQWRIATSISRGISWISNRKTGLALGVPMSVSSFPGTYIQQLISSSESGQTWKFKFACTGGTCCFFDQPD